MRCVHLRQARRATSNCEERIGSDGFEVGELEMFVDGWSILYRTLRLHSTMAAIRAKPSVHP